MGRGIWVWGDGGGWRGGGRMCKWPVTLLSLMLPYSVETLVYGMPNVDMAILKEVARWMGCLGDVDR